MHYVIAIRIYKNVAKKNLLLKEVCEFNIKLCQKRILNKNKNSDSSQFEEDYCDVMQSQFFDAEYYERKYLCNAETFDPIEHYLTIGWTRGYNPSERFNAAYYLYTNEDVRSAEINPLLHYIRFGIDEERLPVPSDYETKEISLKASKCFFLENRIKDTFEEQIDIIIPVYNGFDYLKILFESIFANTYGNYRLIVCDDSSTDIRVGQYLKKLDAENENLIYIENNINLGFIGTVNHSLKYVKNHFVILNTDTEVPSGWLERLMHPIFNNSNVASTTPFTNSGTVCSFPNYLMDNEIYRNLSVGSLDNFFSYLNPKVNINIPTGVGFCMGVNFDVVKKIGFFDIVYGKGYCEENDWCRRAVEHGFVNVHVANLFVYHKHGGSFLSKEKTDLQKENYKILCKRYPDYSSAVDACTSKNEMKVIRKSLRGLIDNSLDLSEVDDLKLTERVKVCYCGHLSSHSGVGVAARSYIRAMREVNLNVECFDASSPGCFDSLLTEIVLNSSNVVVLHFTANELLKFAEFNIDKIAFLKRTCCVIGVWAWESNEPSTDFYPASRYVDHVWSISSYMASALSDITCSTTVIPHPVTNKYNKIKVQYDLQDIKNTHNFVVGYMFDFRSYVFRKNPIGAVDAFLKAFENNCDAALVIKVSGVKDHLSDFNRLVEVVSAHKNIYLINKDFSDEEIVYFYRTIDVYLALFRAEGFGLTIAEAMAYGIPVIMPSFSGVVDYSIGCDGAIFVPFVNINIPDNWGPYKKGWVWADPDTDQAANHLLDLYNNRDKSNALGKLASNHIRDVLSYERIGNIILNDLKTVVSEKFKYY